MNEVLIDDKRYIEYTNEEEIVVDDRRYIEYTNEEEIIVDDKRYVLEKKVDKKDYINYNFTKEGQKLFTTYLESLTKTYFDTKVYPFKMGIVFGIPLFDFTSTINSKNEFEGRLKQLMQLLRKETVSIIDKKGNTRELKWR